MPYKERAEQLKAQKDHYQKNKAIYRERGRARKKAMQDWLWDLKCQRTCERCPENDAACLDFHHKDPKTKLFEIATAISNRVSKEKILAEIEKCRCICSNCHRKLHCKRKRR
jgi:hypothetical protein